MVKWTIVAACLVFGAHAAGRSEHRQARSPREAMMTVPIRLTDPAWNSRGPAWNKRGDRLAFESNPRGDWDIYTMRPDGGALTTITSGSGDERYPSWSPDGRKIVFAATTNATTDLFIADVRTKVIRQLTRTPEVESFPSWSPDGKRIAFSATLSSSDASNVFVIRADGTGLEQLTHGRTRSVFPRWSPDGARLAFFSRRHTDGVDDEVYVMDVATRETARLTTREGHDFSPSWSPDGRAVAMVSLTPDGARVLRIVQLDGHELMRWTGIERVSDPALAPDGRRIAYAAAAGENLAVYLLDMRTNSKLWLGER